MIRNKIIYALCGLLVLSACKKNDAPSTTPDTNLGFISFTNANSSSKTLNIFVDGKAVNATAVAVNGTLTGIYAGFAEGSRALVIKDATVTPNVDVFTGNVNITKGASYSFFQYGVLTGGLLKGVLLNTDRSADPNPENARVRFLNLSNGAPALDIVFIRQEGTTLKDSAVVVGGVPSLATVTPDINALSAYKSIAANKAANSIPGVAVSSYIIRLKLAGTNTVVASTAATTIVPGKNYTFYARGTYPSTVLSSVLDN